MSENYRALTRKYRPQNFEDIVSQDHVSNTLMNAIKQNRLSHAYMFCGPRGVGKTTMARVLARTINHIDNSVDGESLNQTLNIVEMDAASNNKVDDVHHLRESVRIPPQNGRYKVFIVDEVHMLSKAAFNALLKTLEEPPEHAIFIFATTEPHKVLPTILSRVQRFDFKRIGVDEIVHRLRKISVDEGIAIDEESLHVIAKKADGALRDALGLMDQAIAFCGDTITHQELLQALNVVGTDRLFQFMQCVKAHDADQGLELINTLLQEGYDIQEFLIGLTEHLRNLYIAHHNEQLYLVEASEDTKQKYRETAPDFSRDDLMRMLHIVSEAQIKIKDAHQPRIQFEITLLKLIHMERSENLNELLAALEEVKKNSSNQQITATKPDSEPKNVESPAVQSTSNAEYNGSTNGTSQPVDVPPTPQAESKVETPTDVMLAEEEEEDDEFDMGTPVLQTRHTKLKKVEPAEAKAVTTSTPVEGYQSSNEEAPKARINNIDEVKAAWPSFLEAIKADFPIVLQLQVERTQPISLKGSELTLECDNALSKKMLDEQAQDLARKLQECTGTLFRFNVTVSAKQQQEQSARNPYERFKEIQQKDPILKELVERFGAELEY
ncbi:DNA polymerase III subunit gamma/tau [Balneola vulgaris]|uniref:DNA polymerase III subunit gamma/tau n=1 Tax=Balneola vulgaris TaxID=287535 RepID=UPI00036D7669|nr:DNA polymerase III subunit gamma/tau [Balneola vulgaris]